MAPARGRKAPGQKSVPLCRQAAHAAGTASAPCQSGFFPAKRPRRPPAQVGARRADAGQQARRCRRPFSGREKMRGRPVSRVLSGGRNPLDDHSSDPAVADGLQLPTRASGLKRPCGAARCRTARLRPLFGIAPGGACRAVPVARSAVGLYPTVSPSPRNRCRSDGADSSLWRFPSGCPGRALPGTPASWSPDFPRQGLRPAAVIQPSAQTAVKGAPRPRQPESAGQGPA